MEAFTNSKSVVDDFNNKLAELEELINLLYSFGLPLSIVERLINLTNDVARREHELDQETKTVLFSWKGTMHE